MKPNQDDQKSLQNICIITAEKEASSFNDLLNYLNNDQQELQSNLANYGAVVIREYEIKTRNQFQQVGLSIFPNKTQKYSPGQKEMY